MVNLSTISDPMVDQEHLHELIDTMEGNIIVERTIQEDSFEEEDIVKEEHSGAEDMS